MCLLKNLLDEKSIDKTVSLLMQYNTFYLPVE